MRRSVLILAWLAVVLAPGAAHAAWGTSNQHQLVPAYFYPDWWNVPNNWTRICDGMNRSGGPSTAIMNPSSGPGAAASPDYTQAIALCHARGQQVIGYVHTSYGARSLAAARADIDAYFAFYPGIDGIFLDEMSNDAGTRAYYRSLYRYARDKPGSRIVVGNPGAAAASGWQLTTPVADAVVVFEGTAATYARWSPPSWVRTRPASTISNLVYATPAGAATQQVCAASKTRNAGYLYVTDDALPNPWDALPAGTSWACR